MIHRTPSDVHEAHTQTQMQPRHQPQYQSESWQGLLANAIRDPAELLALLELPDALLEGAQAAAQGFSLRVPRGFAALMRPGDPADPLLRQVLPLRDELDIQPGFSTDPLQEQGRQRRQGLLEKYQGRSLLVTTGACAVHCRYCFRRHFPYTGQTATQEDAWQGLAEHLEARQQAELILSGGDPLTLGDHRLAALVQHLAQAPGLMRLRLHSRLPVVLPERISPGLLESFAAFSGQLILVIHANHPRELTPGVARAMAMLKAAGWRLYNQSVLLRGVNDSAEVLAELSQRLFELDVQPYYLHLLDPVLGAAHFEVPMEEARRIHQQLAAGLPGYMLPRLVREVPGQPCKTPL